MNNTTNIIKNAALPHYSGFFSITRGIWLMNALLGILLIWGTLLYGPRALFLVFLSIVSALLSEILIVSLSHRKNISTELANGTAFMCGSLFGLSLPVTVHWFIAIAGPVFAITVIKWGAGGLGKNWLNPALGGRLFVSLTWPQWMTVNNWGRSLLPGLGWNVDATSKASDLTYIKNYFLEQQGGQTFRALSFVDREFSTVDNVLVRLINEQFLIPRGIVLPEGFVDYLLGIRYGAIGESSIVLILLISTILLARDIIAWQIPLGGFIGISCLTYIFSGAFWGGEFFSGDVLFALLNGGFLFTLMFMATDPVTSPYSSNGKLFFGLGFAVLTFIFREFSVHPEGLTLAILIMNMCTPLINNLKRRKYQNNITRLVQ